MHLVTLTEFSFHTGCRSTDVAEKLLPKYREQGITTGSLTVYKLDTSSLQSVRAFAKTVKEKYNKINYLINNGIYGGDCLIC